MRHYL